MENSLPSVESEPVSARDCAICAQPAMQGDYPASLCGNCREQFTRLNVPLWIRAFAGGIGVILLFSLFTLPRNIGLGIHLERGEKAARGKKYFTAERELKEFLHKMPDNVEAKGYLMISAFYNQDYPIFSEEIKKLEHVNIEDQDLLSKMNRVITKADNYVSNDSFENFKTPSLPLLADSAWKRYFLKNAEDNYARMEYAGLLFDRTEYRRCDSLLQLILQADDEYFPALMMGASVKRETGDPEAALLYNDRILAVNHESAYGLSSKSRTLLRQKKDKMALDLALKGYELNQKNEFVLASLILAYYFNGRIAEKDALVKTALSQVADSSDRVTIQYALDVIDKKEKFRD